MKYILTLLLLITSISVTFAEEKKAPIEITAGVDLNSAYVFHGMTYNSGPVLQPFLTFNKSWFVYTFWSNYNLHSDDNGLGHFESSEFTEMDHFFTFLLPVKCVSLDATLGLYTYPALGWPSDKELQLGMEKSLCPFFTPFARAGYMFDGAMEENLYIEFGAKGEAPLSDQLIFGYNVKASWEKQPFIPTSPSGMKHMIATGSFTYMTSEKLGIVAKANYVHQFDEEILPDALYEVDFHASIGMFVTF